MMLKIKRVPKKETKLLDKEWDDFDKTIGIRWREGEFVFGAFQDGKLVGYATLNITGGVGYVHELFVSADFRGKGIGRSLIKEIEEFCKTKGCHKMTLKTSERHKTALEIYKKLEYKTEAVLESDKFKLTW